jgi:biopolymer transport protein ExbD
MGYFKKKRCEIQLTPLIDVVFQLLIFFMISTTFSKVITKLDVKLPEAKAVAEQRKKDTIIEISLDGKLAFNGNIVSYDELENKLAEVAQINPDEVVIIKADKTVDYGKVVKAIGLCKSHRLNKIAMAALQE